MQRLRFRWRLLTISRENKPLLILVAPNGSYRTSSYIKAARRLDFEILVVSDSAHSIINTSVEGLTVDFNEPEQAIELIQAACSGQRVNSVLATDDRCVPLANRLSEFYGLPHNPAAASQLTQRKDQARLVLKASDCLTPEFELFPLAATKRTPQINYPLVIKPLGLSASRGVIRVDNQPQFEDAISRVSKIVESTRRTGLEGSHVLLETYIEGNEYAVEGFLNNGVFRLLTIFDKPEPLQGPFFEETYYISPTRLSIEDQQQLETVVASCCEAYGLVQGPIHAEIRINDLGIYLIELANRTIGGQCGQMIESIIGMPLEDMVVMGMTDNLPTFTSTKQSVGVLMIPIPEAGLLKRIEGLTDALSTQYVDDLEIHINPGYEMVPLPEGASYLGFIFARSPDFQSTWNALREAHEKLKFVTQPRWLLEVG